MILNDFQMLRCKAAQSTADIKDNKTTYFITTT